MSHPPAAGPVTAAGDGTARLARVLPAGASAGRRLVAGVLLPALAVAVAVMGLDRNGTAGISALQGVAFALIVTWAATAVVTGRARERTPQWQVAGGAALAAAWFAASQLTAQVTGGRQDAARAVAALAGPLVIAVSLHLLLALPDGRLASRARQVMTVLGYAAAVAAGIVLAAGGRPLSGGAAAVAWPLALACALPAVRLRYLAVAGRDRERMQWAAAGVVLALTAGLAVVVLHLLVGSPSQLAAVTAAATVLVPLALIAGDFPALGPSGGRVLVHVLSSAGFAVAVSAIYLVVVLGLGSAPSDHADRQVLALSMLAAAVAAVGYVPARDRLTSWATRVVFGARQAPDEVLRTFGSRLTRAITMD
ncbi:MAG: hypothetical protein ABJB47_04645, partial [Actinomycetota bacterium]